MMGSLVSPKYAQIAPVGVEENLALFVSSQIVPAKLLTSLEFTQTVSKVVDDLIELGQTSQFTQTSSEFTQTAMVGVAEEKGMLRRGFLLNLPSPELAQTVPVGSSFRPKPSGPSNVSERSKLALVLVVPKAQLLVNGLTEAQAWFLGWSRDGTRSHELLAVIDCFEEQTRRKNEVAPPPVCSMELSKLKAMLEAGERDDNRESVVPGLALFVATVAGVLAVPPTAPDEAGCITSPKIPVGRGKFLFPLVLKDVSTFASLTKRSFGSKTAPRREAIQLYRITRRELEHRISTACSVYFGDKDWG